MFITSRFLASKTLAAPVRRAPSATRFVAKFSLTPLALCAAQLVGAQVLPDVTIRADTEQGYSPSSSSSATKSSAPLRDIPQTVNVVPGQLLRDQAARSMEDALRNVPGVAASHGDGQRDQVMIRGFTAIADQFS
ncbi:MAG: TonB-dependent receptor plug domain-containing protein, partial [Polaromonas sp.]|nr:TonB-dependent receptor plug domain-containing protein [Polaromonas sp.]